MACTAPGRIGPGVRWFAFLSVGGAACLVGLMLTLAQTAGGPSGETLFAEIARLRAVGCPVTRAEAYGALPEEGRDAVAALGVALKRRLASGAVEESFWHVGTDASGWERWDVERRAALTAHLAAQRPFLEDAVAAAALPRWSMDDAALRRASGEQPGDASDTVYDATRVVHAFAVGAAAPGDRLDAIEVLLTMGARLETASAWDCQLASHATEYGLGALAIAVERGDLRAADAIQRFDDLLAAPRLSRWPRVARGDLAAEAEGFASCFGRGAPPRGGGTLLQRTERLLNSPFAPRPVKCPAEWSAADVALHLDARHRMSGIALEPWTEFVQGTDPIVRTLVRARLEDDGDAIRRTAWCILDEEAQCRLARVALAARAHRDRSGAWPAALSELADRFSGGLPVSPMDGRPPQWTCSATQVTVSMACPLAMPTWYSAGRLAWTFAR